MARSISAANQAALAARKLYPRDFLSITAREWDTGNPQRVNFWSDTGNFSAQVINPDTGNVETRSFYGSGRLIQADDIPLVANVTVQTVRFRMSQLDELVAQAVRGYDCKQARVELYRGLLDPRSRRLVAPAECRFIGFLDDAPITTPAENEDGGIVLAAKSHTQEMTRANPDTRSDVSQKERDPTDDFFKDVAVVGEWEMFWGVKSGKIGK